MTKQTNLKTFPYKVGDRFTNGKNDIIISHIGEKLIYYRYDGQNGQRTLLVGDFENWLNLCSYRVCDYDHANPEHYQTYDKETWEMMLLIWGKEKFIAHCEMCAFKYRMRLGNKPEQPTERELSKIKWYEDKAKELKGEL